MEYYEGLFRDLVLTDALTMTKHIQAFIFCIWAILSLAACARRRATLSHCKRSGSSSNAVVCQSNLTALLRGAVSFAPGYECIPRPCQAILTASYVEVPPYSDRRNGGPLLYVEAQQAGQTGDGGGKGQLTPEVALGYHSMLVAGRRAYLLSASCLFAAGGTGNRGRED